MDIGGIHMEAEGTRFGGMRKVVYDVREHPTLFVGFTAYKTFAVLLFLDGFFFPGTFRVAGFEFSTIVPFLFICAGVYLNWSYNNRQKTPDLTDTLNAEQVMGEATLQMEDAAEPVSLDTSSGSTDDYFAQMRLSRQSSRDSAVELLEETIAYDEGTTVGDTASQTLNRIVGAALSEAQIESLIIAKGFTDCVTYMADDTVSVAVSAPAEGLSTADVALISDVVTSQTDYDLSQVRVIEVKAQ